MIHKGSKWGRVHISTQKVNPAPFTLLDVETVLALDSLPHSFHGDPADRLIVATARAHALPFATRDTRIRRSRVVRLWKPGQDS